jgi:hypothetical protein
MTAVPVHAPLTRAQKFQWSMEKGLAQDTWSLPESLPDAAVHDLIVHLQNRFEVLRTSIDQIDGRLVQVVHADGPRATVLSADGPDALGAVCSRLADEFVSQRRGRLGEALARFAAVRSGRGRTLVCTADNVAVDAAFSTILEAGLAAALGAPGAEEAVAHEHGLQPCRFAEWEVGPDALRERDQAAHHLHDHFRVTPPRLLPAPSPDASHPDRYYRCTATIDHADTLLGRILQTTGILPSAVVLATYIGLLCRRGDACSVNVSASNRHRRDYRTVLGAMAQRAPVILDASPTTVAAAAASAAQALTRGHPVRARYDPDDYRRILRDAELERGLELAPDLAFNFVPPPQGWGRTPRNGPAAAQPRRPSMPTLQSTRESFYEYAASLSARWPAPDTMRLSIHADRLALDPEESVSVLRGVERALVLLSDGNDPRIRDLVEEPRSMPPAGQALQLREEKEPRWPEP